MLDSDIEDSFLLEALEEVEKNRSPNEIHDSVYSSYNIINSEEKNVSPPQTNSSHEASSRNNIDFRSNLLKSLINSRNTANSTHENIKTRTSESTFEKSKITKRKFCDNIQTKNLNNLINPKIPKYEESEILLKLNEKQISLTERNSHSDINLNISPLQKSATINSPLNSVVKKRKFPGPAGILPHWGTKHPVNADLFHAEASELDESTTEDSICSQNTAHEFLSGPWRQMKMELIGVAKSVETLLQTHTVRSILRKGSLKGHASIRKISFIAVLVRSIDLSHLDATAVFHDETGEIHGTISKDVVEKYSDFISPGAVFVLKDATVLSPAGLQPGAAIIGQLKKQYLNITINSVLVIYNIEDDGSVRKAEAVKLTKELIDALSISSKKLNERRELIENEEERELSLFENIGSSKNSSLQTSNIPIYKNPTPNSWRVPSLSKPNQNPLLVCVSKPPFPNSPLREYTPNLQNKTNINTRNSLKETATFGSKSVSIKNHSSSSKQLSNIYLSSTDDGDDDELDSILATIDFDSLQNKN